MARHRDIRNMDYTDDYDGYDDVYGHSLDDDYYISPSNRQFVYNRETSRDGRFEHADDIQEVDEIEELSDTDKAKLHSCLDQIKDTLGPVNMTRNEVVNIVLKYKFNMELIMNAVLERSNSEQSNTVPKEKDVTLISKNIVLELNSSNKQDFTAPCLFHSKSELDSKLINSRSKITVLSNISGSKPQTGLSSKNFTIPEIFSLQKMSRSEICTTSSKIPSNPGLSSPKNFIIPDIFGSNTELKSEGCPKYSTIQTDSSRKIKLSPTQNIPGSTNFKIPNIFNSEPHSNVAITSSSPKAFNIPNIFGIKSSGSSLDISSNTTLSTESNKTEYNSLSELVSSHLHTSSFKDSDIPTNKINLITKKLSAFQIPDSNQCFNSQSSDGISCNDSIDLTKALKVTASLPNFHSKKANNPEKFEIPFIDCDPISKNTDRSTNTRKALICTLNINHILNVNIKYSKKPSKFGKVICRKYRNLQSSLFTPKPLVLTNVKRFSFNTISPDDFIGSHLKR